MKLKIILLIKKFENERAKKIGYKGKEIKLLIFEIREGELVGIIDSFTLADIFSNKT
jgi:hypothetical protein